MTSLSFYPVGQGLFCSGNLLGVSWIYDCGTVSSKKYLINSIEKYKINHPEERVDFLVISHFDTDHISGIISLLKIKKVTRIFLPLTSVWQRMQFLLSRKKYVSIATRDFIINPVTFLQTKMNSGEINRSEIIFIPPYPRDTPEQQDNQSPPEDDLTINKVDIPWSLVPSIGIEEKQLYYGIKAIASDCRLVKKIWTHMLLEFLFYSDPSSAGKIDGAFLNEINKEAEILLCNRDVRLKKDALSRIKRIYESKFKTSKERNKISIFMFVKVRSILNINLNEIDDNIVLYTGDGFLSDQNDLDKLNNFSGGCCPVILQVMHHGSRNNWHLGLGGKLKPNYAIFSADPIRKPTCHPDKEVVCDFAAASSVIKYATTDCGISFVINYRCGIAISGRLGFFKNIFPTPMSETTIDKQHKCIKEALK